MNLEVIKKLLRSQSRDDNILGLHYLADYIDKWGMESINKHTPRGVRLDCYHLTDFECKYWNYAEGLLCVHKNFSLNLGSKNVVYSPSYGGHYATMIKEYERTDNIIYV